MSLRSKTEVVILQIGDENNAVKFACSCNTLFMQLECLHALSTCLLPQDFAKVMLLSNSLLAFQWQLGHS